MNGTFGAGAILARLYLEGAADLRRQDGGADSPFRNDTRTAAFEANPLGSHALDDAPRGTVRLSGALVHKSGRWLRRGEDRKYRIGPPVRMTDDALQGQ